MKVLISAFACLPNWGSEPGVGWNWAVNMAKYNEVWVVTRKNNQKLIEAELDKLKIKNLKFIYLSVPLIDWIEERANTKLIHVYYKMWQKYILKKMISYDKVYNFDIVHHVTYNEFRNPGYLWKLNKPFILGPIGGGQMIEPQLKDYCESKINLFQEKVRDKINLKIKKSRYLSNAINNSSKVLVADSGTYNFLECSGNKYKLYLETGIKQEQIWEKEYKNSKKLNIFWSGNLIYRKGLGILIDAFNKVDNKENYRINIIGDGPLKEYYIKKIQRMGLEAYFNFIGRITFGELQDLYKECDVFTFTSLRDTSGNVVLEAMAKGIPVITLNHNGVGDIVTEKCGIKVDVKSKDEIILSFIDAIERMRNVEVREYYGRNCIERIKKYYLWEEKAKFMQGIYEKVKVNL